MQGIVSPVRQGEHVPRPSHLPPEQGVPEATNPDAHSPGSAGSSCALALGNAFGFFRCAPVTRTYDCNVTAARPIVGNTAIAILPRSVAQAAAAGLHLSDCGSCLVADLKRARGSAHRHPGLARLQNAIAGAAKLVRTAVIVSKATNAATLTVTYTLLALSARWRCACDTCSRCTR